MKNGAGRLQAKLSRYTETPQILPSLGKEYTLFWCSPRESRNYIPHALEQVINEGWWGYKIQNIVTPSISQFQVYLTVNQEDYRLTDPNP